MARRRRCQVALDQLTLPLGRAMGGCSRARRRTRLQVMFENEWRAYPGRLSMMVLEGLARGAYVKAGLLRVLGCSAFWLLLAHEVRWHLGHPLGGSDAQLLNHAVVIYRVNIARRILGLAVFHEFAHWLLDEHYRHEHDHRDVWILTLLLAFPADHLRIIRAEGWSRETLIRYQPHAEGWALAARAWIARHLARAA
jgi:hypothetical protein